MAKLAVCCVSTATLGFGGLAPTTSVEFRAVCPHVREPDAAVCSQWVTNETVFWSQVNPKMLNWLGLVQDAFPSVEWGAALRVAHCESRGNAGAYNRSGATGLFQVVRSWARGQSWGRVFGDPPRSFAQAREWLLDPVHNVRRAGQIFERSGGWHHWRFSRHCHGVR